MKKRASLGSLSLFIIFWICTTQATPMPSRYYIVPTDFLQMINPSPLSHEVLLSAYGLNLTRLESHHLLELTSRIHKVTHICGGYYDVTDEVMAGKNAQELLREIAYSPSRKPQDQPLQEPQFPSEVAQTLSLVKRARFESLLKELAAFPDRYSKNRNGKDASTWIHNKISAWITDDNRTDVTIEEVATGSNFPQNSVVVKIAGRDSSLAGALLGAHIDTYPNAKPGADDDASGAAATLEVLNAILSSQISFKRDLYFVFYAAEEVGLVGSSRVSQLFSDRNTPLRAVMQLDMIGYLSSSSSDAFYFISDYTDPELTEFVKKLAIRYLGIPNEQIGSTRCGYACSDHASWNRRGFSTVFPFESDFDDFNPYIHTGRDRIDEINIDHALNFVNLAATFLVESGEPEIKR